MKSFKAVTWLSGLVAVLGLVASALGLFWQDGGSVFTFTSLRGLVVPIYGQGLYHFDTWLIGAGTRGTDATTLVIDIPLLVLAVLLYRRGSLRGMILLAGVLAYFLYYYASLALGNAYNPLFLVYIALVSASLYAFLLTLGSIDLAALPAHFSPGLPRRGIAAYLIAVGLLLLFAWLPPLVTALVQNQAPAAVASYTTVITFVLDLAIIVPAVFVAALLLLRRAQMGYLLASLLLVLSLTIGVSLMAQGAAQLLAGVPLTAGEILQFMAPFAFLTLVGAWPTVFLFRNISRAPWQPTTVEMAHA